ncbi:hypothetical protein [Marivita sp.]|uniref:hypothetical protein n=1 Tax=Marivita sp. TaxID=2003365 RepID=UPI002627BAF9|nr:hypothetical protein [Marivita sp.]
MRLATSMFASAVLIAMGAAAASAGTVVLSDVTEIWALAVASILFIATFPAAPRQPLPDIYK